MMTEEQNREEQREESATSLPSRLDAHGTRKKTKKKDHDTESYEEDLSAVRKDYYKSPMIARALLSMFIVMVVVIFGMMAFFS